MFICVGRLPLCGALCSLCFIRSPSCPRLTRLFQVLQRDAAQRNDDPRLNVRQQPGPTPPLAAGGHDIPDHRERRTEADGSFCHSSDQPRRRRGPQRDIASELSIAVRNSGHDEWFEAQLPGGDAACDPKRIRKDQRSAFSDRKYALHGIRLLIEVDAEKALESCAVRSARVSGRLTRNDAACACPCSAESVWISRRLDRGAARAGGKRHDH